MRRKRLYNENAAARLFCLSQSRFITFICFRIISSTLKTDCKSNYVKKKKYKLNYWCHTNCGWCTVSIDYKCVFFITLSNSKWNLLHCMMAELNSVEVDWSHWRFGIISSTLKDDYKSKRDPSLFLYYSLTARVATFFTMVSHFYASVIGLGRSTSMWTTHTLRFGRVLLRICNRPT